MTAHDQNPTGFDPGFNEDEDLFDFPRIELTSEGLRHLPDSSSKNSSAADPFIAVAPPLPSARATAPSVLTSAPTPAAAVPAIDVPAASAEIAPVAQQPSIVSASAPRRRAMQAALIALFVLNGAGFWFLWRTHVTFGAGIDNLRTELDDAAKRLERARRETAARAGSTTAVEGATELGPLEVLERSSLVLAENDIKAGEYGTARRRLNRLLAQADRMSPSLRAEIEPRATFLVARSYQDEADTRRRPQR